MAGAASSVLLGADDAYLLHETIKNRVGIPSPVTIGLYGLVVIYLFYRARQYLASRADLSVFALSIAFLALSAFLDFSGEAGLPTPPLSAVIEDVVKFLGITVWMVFFYGVGRDIISTSHAESVPDSA